MTSEAQRVAIAEARGWKGPHHTDTIASMKGWWSQHRGVWWLTPEGKHVLISSVPDYLNDRNTIVEAILHHTPEHKQGAFVVMLARVMAGTAGKGGRAQGIRISVPQFCMICARPEQLCEAFLRTLNLWKD